MSKSLTKLVKEIASKELHKTRKMQEHVAWNGGELDNVDFNTLMKFLRAYSSLGHSIQEQLDVVIDRDEDRFEKDVNPNAIRLAEDKLFGACL